LALDDSGCEILFYYWLAKINVVKKSAKVLRWLQSQLRESPSRNSKQNQYTVVCALLPFGCYELEVGKLKISPPLSK
jgi:hypothetical protein